METTMRSKFGGSTALWWCLMCCAACGEDDPTPATQIIVAVTSDIEPGTTLTRIEMTLSTRDGEDVVAMQDYAIVASEPDDGQYELPLTFAIGKGEADSFQLVIAGYGPLGTSGEEVKIVEHKAIATFQDEVALLLRVFLGRICLQNFCGGDATLVCYPTALGDVERGDCGAVPEYLPADLPRVNLKKLPDFSMPPSGAVLDGAVGDAAPCIGDECPCQDDDDCDDGLFCTDDVCDEGTGECEFPDYACPDDGNACTLEAECDEQADRCVAAFDETSLTSSEHCGASATAACVPCMADATRTASCAAGMCTYTCLTDRHDVDGNLDNGCECLFTSAVDDADDAAVDSNCDGADGELGAARHLYVTPEGAGDHSGDSPANAATLPEAFTLASTGTAKSLLLASGTYAITAQLVAPDGLSLFGGYAPEFRSREGVSQVEATSASALLIKDSVTGVSIDSVSFATADQDATPGAYTHTLDINNAQNVSLKRLTVRAGAGAAGSEGSAGTTGTAATVAGATGSTAPSTATGGSGGSSAGSTGLGGNGGKGGDYVSNVVYSGIQGSVGTSTGVGCGGGGPGGPGQDPSCIAGNYLYGGDAGQPGQPGCTGPVGSHAAGGTGAGSVAGDGSWTPAAAGVAGPGTIGGSGGGGGGGGAISCSTGSAGGGGGEGGSGGFGGGPGGAGGAGGASIGILTRASTITVDTVTIATSTGGAGGQGGSGGPGGEGASGGGGGQGITTGSNPSVRGGSGGVGGKGGTGGRGGCGGGGAGGPSIGIFGMASTVLNGTPSYQPGTGGSAGPVCTAGGGNVGSVGVVANTHGF